MQVYKRIAGDYAEYLCDEKEAEILLRAIGSDIPRPCKVFVTVIHVGLDTKDLQLYSQEPGDAGAESQYECFECVREES